MGGKGLNPPAAFQNEETDLCRFLYLLSDMEKAPPQIRQQQQVGRVKDVEQIFQHRSFHPAAFSIIQGNGNPGENSFPFPVKTQGSCEKAGQGIAAQQIEDGD